MSAEEKLRFIETVMDLEAGTLNGDEYLEDLDAWDSMAILAFMTEMRVRFDKIITTKAVRIPKTINELCDLI